MEQLGHRWAELSLVAAQPHPERNLTSLAEETERGQRRERPMRPTVALAIGRDPNGRALRKVTLPIGRSGGLVLGARACVCFPPCRHDMSREFGGCRGRMSCEQRGAHRLAERGEGTARLARLACALLSFPLLLLLRHMLLVLATARLGLPTVRRDRLAHLLLLEVLLVAIVVQHVEQARILPRRPARDHSQVRTHLGPLRRAEEACHVLPEQLMSLGAPRCAVRGGLCTRGLNLLLLDHLVVTPLLGLCGRRRLPRVRLRHGREELLLQPVRLEHFGFDDAQLSICLRVRQQLIGRHLRIVLGVQEAHAHVRHMVLAALSEVSHAPDLRWPPRETLDLGPHEVATLVVGDHSRHSGLGRFSWR